MTNSLSIDILETHVLEVIEISSARTKNSPKLPKIFADVLPGGVTYRGGETES